ncbi:MAG TPA: response regulator [Chloroflexota bacterium]|nr:response regulator [Chloroflexota bacterium]
MATAYRDSAPIGAGALSGGSPHQRDHLRPMPRGVRPVVLVVEPDPGLRAELAASLRQCGAVVDQAADGIAALYALGQRHPDGVVLDMDIAGVTGHRLLDILRLDPGTRCVPVVVLSEREALESCPRPLTGAPPESFLRKPVDANVILRELTQLGALRAHVHLAA